MPELAFVHLIPIVSKIIIISKNGISEKEVVDLSEYKSADLNIAPIFEMASCPKCKRKEDFRLKHSFTNRRYRVCCSCGHKGPWASTKNGDAIEEWNKQQGTRKEG